MLLLLSYLSNCWLNLSKRLVSRLDNSTLIPFKNWWRLFKCWLKEKDKIFTIKHLTFAYTFTTWLEAKITCTWWTSPSAHKTLPWWEQQCRTIEPQKTKIAMFPWPKSYDSAKHRCTTSKTKTTTPAISIWAINDQPANDYIVLYSLLLPLSMEK